MKKVILTDHVKQRGKIYIIILVRLQQLIAYCCKKNKMKQVWNDLFCYDNFWI